MTILLAKDRVFSTRSWVLVSVLSFANLAAAMDRHIVSLLLGPIKDSLHLSDTQLGLLQGPGFAVLYALAILMSGFLLARIDRLRMVLAGLVVWTSGMAGLALAPDFASLFAARVLVGLGQGVLVPAALSLIGDYIAPHARARSVGLFTASGATGRGLALIAGGAMLAWVMTISDFADPWRWSALALLLPNVLVAVALAFHPRDIEDRDHTPLSLVADFNSACHWLWRHRVASLGITVANIASVLLVQTMAAWAPLFLYRMSGWSLADIGWTIGIVSLAGAGAGNLLGGWLADAVRQKNMRTGPAMAITAPLLFAILMAALFCFAPSPTLAIAGLLGFNLFAGMAIPASLASLQQARSMHAPGLAVTMMLSLGTLVGSGAGPFLVGALADALRSSGGALGPSLFIVLAAAAVIGATIVWRTKIR